MTDVRLLSTRPFGKGDVCPACDEPLIMDEFYVGVSSHSIYRYDPEREHIFIKSDALSDEPIDVDRREVNCQNSNCGANIDLYISEVEWDDLGDHLEEPSYVWACWDFNGSSHWEPGIQMANGQIRRMK